MRNGQKVTQNSETPHPYYPVWESNIEMWDNPNFLMRGMSDMRLRSRGQQPILNHIFKGLRTSLVFSL